MNENYRYHEKFSDNIFVLGQIVCRKTTFLQNLARNEMSRELKRVNWILKIAWTKDREKKIASSFENTPISFSYLTNIDKFNMLIQNSQWKTKEDYDNEFKNENILGEKRVDKFIVIDNVLGLVINLINLVDFLTASRKFGYLLFIYFITYIHQMSTGK